LFFATIETLATSVIIWQAWTWSEVEASSLSRLGPLALGKGRLTDGSAGR
jgi:hypothetical protein